MASHINVVYKESNGCENDQQPSQVWLQETQPISKHSHFKWFNVNYRNIQRKLHEWTHVFNTYMLTHISQAKISIHGNPNQNMSQQCIPHLIVSMCVNVNPLIPMNSQPALGNIVKKTQQICFGQITFFSMTVCISTLAQRVIYIIRCHFPIAIVHILI